MITIATIGTSQITENFLDAAAQCEEVHHGAVYSRDIKKAEAFAKKHGAERYYDSLDALAADPSVDAVYIASPNAMHCRQAVQMMNAGKHVLCEKSMGSNSREVAEMMQASKKNQVVLLEAVRPIFDPGYAVVRENLYKLGKIRGARLWNGRYSSKYTSFKQGNHENIFSRECAAGALMDMGVYCMHPLVGLFGKPENIRTSCVKVKGGADGAGIVLAEYDGMLAEVSYSKIANGLPYSEIQGENGVMRIRDMISVREIVCCYNDGTEEILPVEDCRNNMVYEIRKFVQAVEQGTDITEYNRLSVTVMELMDEVRRQNGIVFPAD